MTDGDGDLYGGSVQLQCNFARGSVINPYIAAGAAFEKEKFDCEGTISQDLVVRAYGKNWPGHGDGSFTAVWDEDGTAFVGRAGLEFDLAPFWLVVEGSYMTEIYKDDDQFEAAARAGFQWTKSCRIDAGIDYYTEWKQFFAGVGLTLCL